MINTQNIDKKKEVTKAVLKFISKLFNQEKAQDRKNKFDELAEMKNLYFKCLWLLIDFLFSIIIE